MQSRSFRSLTTLLGVFLVSGCVALPSTAPPSAVPQSTEVAAPSPSPTGPSPQEVNLDAGCDSFIDVFHEFEPQPGNSPETFDLYVVELEELATALGTLSTQTGDTGTSNLGGLLATAAQASAVLADEMAATGYASNATALAFQTGLQSVGETCNFPIEFVDNIEG